MYVQFTKWCDNQIKSYVWKSIVNVSALPEKMQEASNY